MSQVCSMQYPCTLNWLTAGCLEDETCTAELHSVAKSSIDTTLIVSVSKICGYFSINHHVLCISIRTQWLGKNRFLLLPVITVVPNYAHTVWTYWALSCIIWSPRHFSSGHLLSWSAAPLNLFQSKGRLKDARMVVRSQLSPTSFNSCRVLIPH